MLNSAYGGHYFIIEVIMNIRAIAHQHFGSIRQPQLQGSSINASTQRLNPQSATSALPILAIARYDVPLGYYRLLTPWGNAFGIQSASLRINRAALQQYEFLCQFYQCFFSW